MRNSREDMDAAIKARVLPHLRTMGFSGSLPNLRRERGDAVDLLCFQFRSSGGAFVVEIGRVSSEGFDFRGARVLPAKARVAHTRERQRLGSELRINYGDYWFSFDQRDPDEVAREVVAELDRPEVWALVDQLEVLGRD